jgi:enterochelin esterase-like enzyme
VTILSVIASVAKQSRSFWIAASLAVLAMTMAALLSGSADAKGLRKIEVRAGSIVDLGVLTSKYSDPRRVVVWLPSGYRPNGPKHAVLYMHDGQNLFDRPAAGYGTEWEIDETLDWLIREKKVRPTIVVGIWSTRKRLREYVPSKAFEYVPPKYMDRVRGLYQGDPLSDGYLKFIVSELRPMIDRRFNVKTDPANTVIMGSSMGALISLYAIDEYPQIFGGAGMMSTHWPQFVPAEGAKSISDEEYEIMSSAFERYLSPALPDPKTHKLYFDDGNETLDPIYARYQKRIEAVVAQRGYRQGVNWSSRNFPGQKHNALSWSSRVEIPLQFLLPPSKHR